MLRNLLGYCCNDVDEVIGLKQGDDSGVGTVELLSECCTCS